MIQITREDVGDDYHPEELHTDVNIILRQNKVCDLVQAFHRCFKYNTAKYVYRVFNIILTKCWMQYPMIYIILNQILIEFTSSETLILEKFNELGIENVYDIDEYNVKIGDKIINDMTCSHYIMQIDDVICNHLIKIYSDGAINMVTKPVIYTIQYENDKNSIEESVYGSIDYTKHIVFSDYSKYVISTSLHRCVIAYHKKEYSSTMVFSMQFTSDYIQQYIRDKKLQYINNL